MTEKDKRRVKNGFSRNLGADEVGIYAAVVRKQAFKVLLEAEQLSETVIPTKNGMCTFRGEIKPLSQVHTQTPLTSESLPMPRIQQLAILIHKQSIYSKAL